MGIAGGAAKTRLCTEAFGYDEAIDYKAEDLDHTLAAACPDGVDICVDPCRCQSAHSSTRQSAAPAAAALRRAERHAGRTFSAANVYQAKFCGS